MPMLSKIEITIDFNGPEAKLYHSNTQKQNSEYFSNFTELFLSSLSTICTIMYFIRSSGYSNLKMSSLTLSSQNVHHQQLTLITAKSCLSYFENNFVSHYGDSGKIRDEIK